MKGGIKTAATRVPVPLRSAPLRSASLHYTGTRAYTLIKSKYKTHIKPLFLFC